MNTLNSINNNQNIARNNSAYSLITETHFCNIAGNVPYSFNSGLQKLNMFEKGSDVLIF